ncbi:hypothetical protein CGRA01v4_12094 [Colletotrichum graminicola]|nr:hypothetical protein CGRA01v4_12094 [Colletotrichum graminicola]
MFCSLPLFFFFFFLFFCFCFCFCFFYGCITTPSVSFAEPCQEVGRTKNRPQPGAIIVASWCRLARYSRVALRCRHTVGPGLGQCLYPLYSTPVEPRSALNSISGQGREECTTRDHQCSPLHPVRPLQQQRTWQDGKK